MALLLVESFIKGKNTERVNMIEMMVLLMMANLRMICLRVKERLYGMMVKNILANGREI